MTLVYILIVSVIVGAALFFSSRKKAQRSPVRQMDSETRFYPPSKSNIEQCKRLGLEVKPTMSNREVWQLIENAKKDPKIKKLYDEYMAEKFAICDREEREEFGDAVVDERNKWEKFCSPRLHHILIFKKGKTLDADIVEFESANIEGESKYYVKIQCLRPKLHKPRGESPRIEWEQEVTLRPKQIMEVITLPKQIDIFEIKDYENALKRAKELKEKYE